MEIIGSVCSHQPVAWTHRTEIFFLILRKLVFLFRRGLYRERNLQWNNTKICRKIRDSYGLTLDQTRLCKKYADTMPFVHEAATIAIATCQNLFRYRQWNCSSINILPKLSPDLATGESHFFFRLRSYFSSDANAILWKSFTRTVFWKSSDGSDCKREMRFYSGKFW